MYCFGNKGKVPFFLGNRDTRTPPTLPPQKKERKKEIKKKKYKASIYNYFNYISASFSPKKGTTLFHCSL